MKSNLPHAVFLQHARKMLRDIPRLHQFADVVDIDVRCVLFAIHRAAELSVRLLSRFQFQQQLLERRHERQRPEARFGLGAILLNGDALSVQANLRYRVPDGDRLLLKVDCAPF